MATSTPKSLEVTGNPALDGLIMKGLVALSAGLTGLIIGWLNAHGFQDPNYGLLVDSLIFLTLSSGAVAAWGWLNTKAHQVQAVQAGINLVFAGAALMEPESGAPLAVTTATAPQIVKYFAKADIVTQSLPPLGAKP